MIDYLMQRADGSGLNMGNDTSPYIDYQAGQRTTPTPYGQAQIMTSTSQRNFPPPNGGDATSQGRNCYWLSMAALCFVADELLETNTYADIGAGQVDWILGKNPFGVSTVANLGYRFPRMYTKWAFMNDHPGEDGVIPGGAICGIGGNAADEPMLDMREQDLTDWLTNEYWNPPTAWFAMACWRYYRWARGLGQSPSNDIYRAYLDSIAPRRPRMARNFAEGEHFLRQSGSGGPDHETAASSGQVLGQDWGRDNGDYADYELFVTRPLVDPILNVRYACSAGTGRVFDIRWDDQYQSALACTNTGGWGGSSSEYAWASASLSSTTVGIHKLTLLSQGTVEPVNVDCWYFTEGQSVCREGEDYDSQVGSGGDDFKAGASQGEVLGDGWGITSTSEVICNNVNVGSQTAAWLHVWYACDVSSGRVLKVHLDGSLRAHLVCPGTAGWGDAAGDFNMVSACIGALSSASHALKLTMPGQGDGVNLDCFCIGPPSPEFLPRDADRDGLGDDQEDVCGTSAADPDSDGDGLRDGDEVQFGRIEQVTDPALADTDGDDMDDGNEWVSGTDPRDAQSFFKLGQPGTSAGGVSVSWPSVSNRVYTLSRTSTLGNDALPFTNIAVDLPALPPLNCYTDQATEAGTFFYRLQVRR